MNLEQINKNRQWAGKINGNFAKLSNFINGSHFVGIQNPNLDHLSSGFYNFGFWQNGPIPANETSWPKSFRGSLEWGWIIQLGDGNQTKSQLLIGAGGKLLYQIYAGSNWEPWFEVTSTKLDY